MNGSLAVLETLVVVDWAGEFEQDSVTDREKE